jgi:hypothetical protein
MPELQRDLLLHGWQIRSPDQALEKRSLHIRHCRCERESLGCKHQRHIATRTSTANDHMCVIDEWQRAGHVQ